MEHFFVDLVKHDPARLVYFLVFYLLIERRLGQIRQRLTVVETMLHQFHAFHQDLIRKMTVRQK